MAEFKKYSIYNYKIFKCEYYSLDDFLQTIIKKPINYLIFDNPSSNNELNNEWYGTNSFKEAWELCKYTYDEKFEEFRNKINKVSFKLYNKYKYIDCYKQVGSSVNIPRYLFGIPNNMRNKEQVLTSPTVNIYYQIAYSSMTESEQIRNRGILTLALINYLENVKHYKVNLNFFEMAECDNEIIYITINLKKEDEKLKIKKCYFPIVHPSFLRRLIFRAKEIIPNLENNWEVGYGKAINYEKAKLLIENENKNEKVINSIYISTPYELGIEGKNIEEDMDSFIRTINEKYNILEEVKQKKMKYKNDF